MNADNWYQLPPDMQYWNNAVVDNVSQRVPEIINYISSVEWTKIDPSSGSADGLIQLLGGTCAAPIIVRATKLAPIDILVTNMNGSPKFYPLSSLFLQKIYATNVLGEPEANGANDDSDYTGPGMKVKNIKTVDNVKYASAEAAKNLLSEIAKSASVSNWMVENMPDMLIALNDKAETLEKKAKIDIDLPELMVVWRENDMFYANGNQVSAKVVDDFCKMASVTNEEKSGLFAGKPIVRDNREKVAAIHIPTEQDVISMNIEAETLFSDDVVTSNKVSSPDGLYVAKAYLKDGSSVDSVIFTKFDGHTGYCHEDEKNSGPREGGKETDENSCQPSCCCENRELAVSKEGYGFNTNIKTTARIPISMTDLKVLSTESDPAIGMLGIFITNSGWVNGFGRVTDVVTLGNRVIIKYYDLISHKDTKEALTEDNYIKFYEVTDNILPVVNDSVRTDYISVTGINGILTVDAERKLVLDGISHSAVNCPYALMNKYAASYSDAEKICKIAQQYGICEFDVLEKSAAINDNADETKNKKKDDKGTKAGTDDEVETDGEDQNTDNEDVAEQDQVVQDPAAQMSVGLDPMQGQQNNTADVVDIENNPEMGFGIGAGQQQAYGNGGHVDPVTSTDLENVVTLNNPQVMDGYLMAGLASSSLGSRESILKMSESVLKALEELSKMLFLNRQGLLGFVSEDDIQAAMHKLTDVAQQVGLNTNMIGANY